MKTPATSRRFRVTLERGPDDSYGFFLDEVKGTNGESSRVARVDPTRARRLLSPLVDSVKASGHAKTVLHAGRRDPLSLHEEQGVRLSLVMITTAPIAKARRVDAMISGVAAMTAEEAYYWYAKATGPDGARIRRTLRVFLAET